MRRELKMTDKPSSIPPDDLSRTLAVSSLNDPATPEEKVEMIEMKISDLKVQQTLR